MVTDNNIDSPIHRSHLFVLRFWQEELGNGQFDLRGKVQHVNTGEARYFRDWSTLEVFIERLICRIDIHASYPYEGREPDTES